MTLSAPSSPPRDAPQVGGAAYDELWQAPGEPRAHQQLLHEHLTSRSARELEDIRRAIRRRVTEQEVTFNILGVPEGTNRPWQLDALPHVLDRAEWDALATGLAQRARVLSFVLADCYGSQRLLKEGLLPAQLVLGGPGYLRPCHGWEPPGRERLPLVAIDVGRLPSGKFVVHSDRPTALVGAGYALENRLVIGRTLADLFRRYGVERVSGFFDGVRRMINALSPRRGVEPRVVLMSAGAEDETSFEHAYLARYLGYELVEGRDLTVRDDVVYLKTLSGLQRVDVILRRVPDAMADPLHLRENSLQGVAGLVMAARQGQVALANPLGSGLVESPAFKAYLGPVCQRIFGEALEIEAVTTLWLGEPTSLDRALGDLDAYVFKPAFADRRGELIRPRIMSQAQKEAFADVLRARPGWYVAEAWAELSRVPLWRDSELSEGEFSMRTYLCRNDDGYVAFPGGLGRIDSAPDGVFLALRTDRASKDVWVPSLAPSPTHELPSMPDTRVELRRGGLELPSRLLDDIYWLGRYVQRCEITSRVIRAGLERLSLESAAETRRVLPAILSVLREFGVTPPVDDAEGPTATGPGRGPAEVLLLGAIFDSDLPGSLRKSLGDVHRLTLGVRSRLSRDAWHVLRRFTSAIGGISLPEGPDAAGAAIELLDELLVNLAAVSGTMNDNMVRGRVWSFLDMGRRVELGSMTLKLLGCMLQPGASRVHMEVLLEVADSLLTYRARYLSSLQAAPVVDLVLTDDTNPRSVAFQVRVLAEHLDLLPRVGEVVRSRAERRIIALRSSLLTADIEQACSGDGAGLRDLLEDATALLWQFSDDVGQTWFSHARGSQAVAPPAWIDEDLEAPR